MIIVYILNNKTVTWDVPEAIAVMIGWLFLRFNTKQPCSFMPLMKMACLLGASRDKGFHVWMTREI